MVDQRVVVALFKADTDHAVQTDVVHIDVEIGVQMVGIRIEQGDAVIDAALLALEGDTLVGNALGAVINKLIRLRSEGRRGQDGDDHNKSKHHGQKLLE